MARKRRRTARRAFARSSASRRAPRKKSKGRRTKAFLGGAAPIVGAMIYGGGREWLSDKLSPLTANVPAGDIADELTLGAVSWAMAKGKIPVLNKVAVTRDIGKAGLTIEAARLGSYLADRFAPGQMQSSGSNSIYL